MRLFRTKTAFITIILLVITLAAASPVMGDQVDAQTAISSAQTAMINCYDAAKSAEAAGANITNFVDTINHANSLLIGAYFAYSHNDYTTAYDLAVQSQTQLSSFLTELNAARTNAVARENLSFLVAEFSAVGAVAVLAVGMALWFYLGKKHVLGGLRS